MKKVSYRILATFLMLGILAVTSGCGLASSEVEQEEAVQDTTFEPPEHTLEKTNNGAVHMIVASSDMDSSQVDDLKEIVQFISEEDSSGQEPDLVELYGEKPGLTLLQEKRNEYTVDYIETENGAGLKFSSDDPEVVAALHQWVDNGEVPSFGSGDLGVYVPSY